jgi:ABC-type polysaccharide/polyol phosphate export permease
MSTRTAPPPPHMEFFPPPRAPRAPARWLSCVVEDAHLLVRFWPVVQNMVVQELRVRYHRSMLGFLWTLLNPILMMITLTLVFSQVFAVEDWRKYAIYLFAGMVPWSFLQGCLTDCAFCIIVHEGLIRKIYLPKLIFPLNRVLINLTTCVLSLVALFLLVKPLGAQITWPLLLLPCVIALFAAFALGLGLIVATMNTFYRDCGHLVTVFLQAWYFATPIIYYASFIPESARWRLWLNPAYPFIKLFQDIITSHGQWPNPITIIAAAGIAAVSLGVGYAAFKCHEDKLVFRL